MSRPLEQSSAGFSFVWTQYAIVTHHNCFRFGGCDWPQTFWSVFWCSECSLAPLCCQSKTFPHQLWCPALALGVATFTAYIAAVSSSLGTGTNFKGVTCDLPSQYYKIFCCFRQLFEDMSLGHNLPYWYPKNDKDCSVWSVCFPLRVNTFGY